MLDHAQSTFTLRDSLLPNNISSIVKHIWWKVRKIKENCFFLVLIEILRNKFLHIVPILAH